MDCSIIIPVGKGHEQTVNTAIGSAMQAAEEGLGAFTNIHILAGLDDGRGRSAVRNALMNGPLERMLVRSTGDDPKTAPFESEWVFFLDADDVMCNSKIWGGSPFESVEDYLVDFDCIWGPIFELSKDNKITMREQSGNISTYREFLEYPSFNSVQIGHFARRSTFLDFNENMGYCEDVDLYLREWKLLRCLKQDIPFFLNRRGLHSWTKKGGGPNGRDWSEKAEELMAEARLEEGYS